MVYLRAAPKGVVLVKDDAVPAPEADAREANPPPPDDDHSCVDMEANPPPPDDEPKPPVPLTKGELPPTVLPDPRVEVAPKAGVVFVVMALNGLC